MRRLIYTISLLLVFAAVSGCGSSQSIREVRDVVDAVGDVSREGRQVVREAGRTVREVGDTAEEAKEAGQKVRELRKKQFNLVLQRETGGSEDVNLPVRVRPVGSGLESRVLDAGEYVTYQMPVSRYVEHANFSIYTEINGRGRPIKVQKSWRGDVQSGSTEILVLVKVDSTRYVWIPPNVRDRDERIDYGY